MHLDDWLKLSRTTAASLAARVNVCEAAIHRYRKGKRVPSPDVMVRIIYATGGAVQPNDFYADELAEATARRRDRGMVA